ncbi:Uncharacterised protein [Acholeplasma oculi]|uniref:Uncharacterized protein n=1 Tax=Acholeplasma oculi TaxID=35623 RepID=A0A061ACB8_9MOLU|nr:hypothetical protein [Acholeplasma oculi]CDR31478.1 hypothetical protein Aocu_14050 [Acholeplasma oculi]SKC49156.1 hypothetical protein SAMN02745122_1383 [Acholeplasma oculi]SUT92191.1 Uncharacterised protein [Acholeplasma oculi]
MGVLTWGKLKFKYKPSKINNFEQEKIWVIFDIPDDKVPFPLHVSPLESNEIFFDILCDFSLHYDINPNIRPDDYMHNDIFFSLQYTKLNQQKETPILSVELYERLNSLRRIFDKLLQIDNVEKITIFNTELGSNTYLIDYTKVDWSSESFAYNFFKEMNKKRYVYSNNPNRV